MHDLYKVQIITPLISKGFRDDEVLPNLIGKPCLLSVAYLDKGPSSVESAIDEVLAAPGVVDAAIRSARNGAEAVVVDCMLDPGVDAARHAVRLPVIGAGEAGLKAAARQGRFSVVTVLDRQIPAFQTLSMRHGLSDRLASVRAIDVPVLALSVDRDASVARTIEACRNALSADGAEAIVFGCTGMLGFADAVANALGVDRARIIDPLPNAIEAAIKAIPAQGPEFPSAEPKMVRGFESWTDLHAFMRPEAVQ